MLIAIFLIEALLVDATAPFAGSGDLLEAADLAARTLRASAAAFADSRAVAAFSSIAFCFSSSLERIGRMSLGIGSGTWDC